MKHHSFWQNIQTIITHRYAIQIMLSFKKRKLNQLIIEIVLYPIYSLNLNSMEIHFLNIATTSLQTSSPIRIKFKETQLIHCFNQEFFKVTDNRLPIQNIEKPRGNIFLLFCFPVYLNKLVLSNWKIWFRCTFHKAMQVCIKQRISMPHIAKHSF